MISHYFSNDYCSGDVFQDEVAVFAKNRLMDLFRSKRRHQGYREIYTPALLKNDIWNKTGHADFFSENMFFVEDKDSAFKPMSCPGAVLFVKDRYLKSTNSDSFPIKIFEFGRVFRKELSGVSKMMRRLNVFTQDDSHVFCQDVDSCKAVIAQMLDDAIFFYRYILKCSKMEIALSTKPKRSIEDDDQWKTASDIMKDIVNQRGISNVQEEEGAFYGPKIDMIVNDIQLFTCQLDFFLSKKLDLFFHSQKNNISEKIFPIVVHSATMGSIERFLSIIMDDMTLPFWCVHNAFVIVRIENEMKKSSQLQNFFDENKISYVIEDSPEQAFKKYKSDKRYFLFCGRQEDDQNISVRINDVISQIALNDFKSTIKDNIMVIREFFNYDSTF